ncbi:MULTISPECIES: phosphatidylglycerophosphatase A family protein [Halomonadaceae]|jgi:phosphatidylglycerophosphatase A|uniref:phosphatidylglycerophosphatase A family protein n=1 Tax=Halomonadaceae TaxID=28256 RepID=UPI000780D712|nr:MULTISPECIES: phosphatidylglycerophosphatase A [Halomonas]MEC9021138.1 phosphatidylglycerophosphatase A [Pseudomonadota bacterium]MBV65762.1 phosphatidylglycerophosphatase A [Halomonas sp.]MCC4288455.1 phosphatidylglycerophosphatase A [Halomonas meridiana]MCD1652274.1 phosphatidylglycerophosphatase A [Halomonas axialensis]MCD2088402.1 phosphatidylglycerophosphatase A [Halomonas meridiana]|tara:strand:- start:1617 stop:2096 length:480 start_codon:yes stop_codon:yes gene_type:complete
MLDTLNFWLATGFGLGLAPVAPGTFGSLIGLPLAWWLLGRSTGQQAVIIALMLIAAVPVCHIAAWHYDGLDHGSIVADEYVAFPLAVLGLKAARHPLVLALAFGVYRFFDALKPPPIHLAEYVTGGLGIVLDDVIAALVSWLVVALIVTLWQRWQQKIV